MQISNGNLLFASDFTGISCHNFAVSTCTRLPHSSCGRIARPGDPVESIGSLCTKLLACSSAWLRIGVQQASLPLNIASRPALALSRKPCRKAVLISSQIVRSSRTCKRPSPISRPRNSSTKFRLQSSNGHVVPSPAFVHVIPRTPAIEKMFSGTLTPQRKS